MIVLTFNVHVGPGFDSRHLHHTSLFFMIKRSLYIFCVLLLAYAITFSVGKFFGSILKLASTTTDVTVQVSLMSEMWQFVVLGFIIGGIIISIPGKKAIYQLSGSLCMLGSGLLMMFIGFGFSEYYFVRWCIGYLGQMALVFFYCGIAMTLIELLKDIFVLAKKLWVVGVE